MEWDDGVDNRVALITDTGYRAFAYSDDPYGVPTITVDSRGYGTPQNPFLFKNGIQDRTSGWVHFGARWYNRQPQLRARRT